MGCDGHETCGHFSRPSTFLLCYSLFGADSALEFAPFFLDNTGSLHRPMRTHPSSRFLTRMKFGLRSVGARAVRTVEGICAARARLECPWFGVRAFNNTGNWSPSLSNTYAGRVVSYRHRIPNRPPIRDILKTQTRRANPDDAARLSRSRDRVCNYRTNVCQNRVHQAQTRALAVKYPCDASRARAADDSIGGPQMLKFLNVLAALAAVGSFVIAFFDSYEVRFKVRRRTRGADGSRRLRRKRK